VIESYVGGLPVTEIFRQKSEDAFRDLETRALQELSGANSLVVATGGGAVVRDENWEYLRDGVTVWLDVPVEDLARRVTTVGTESRPLLGEDCCDFEKALSKLTKLMDAREQHYAQAHCRLSFRDLASRLQLTGVDALTPAAIAVQVLEEITRVLQEGIYVRPPVGY
jgi:shikimate kinase